MTIVLDGLLTALSIAKEHELRSRSKKQMPNETTRLERARAFESNHGCGSIGGCPICLRDFATQECAALEQEIESLTKSHAQLHDALELAYRWIRVTGLGYGLTSNPDYVAVTEYLEKIRESTLVVRKYGK
jgi:hypothetical protein